MFKLTRCLAAVVSSGLALPASGSSPAPILPPGIPLIGTYETTGNSSLRESQVLDEPGPTGDSVLSIATTEQADNPWLVQLKGSSTVAVTGGDTGLVRFYARAVETSHESAQARLRVVVQDKAGSFPRIATAQFSVDRQWREIFVPIRFKKDHPAGDIIASVDFGYERQTVEISSLSLVSYGRKVTFEALPRTTASYSGHEADASWRREALERIERIRKGDVTIEVVDAAGVPVPDAHVTLHQTGSAFEFGTCVPGRLIVSDEPSAIMFREKLRALFNAAEPENELKWANWLSEGKPADYRAQSMEALRWLNDQGFRVRGHVLIWPGWKRLPASIVALRGTDRESEVPGMILDHIRDITEATKDLVTEWDVLNEPFSNHDLMDQFGKEIMLDWFRVAHEVVPSMPLYLNDWGNHDQTVDGAHVKHFEDTARWLLDHGAPLGGLGLQAHIGGIPAAPEAMLATLDRYWKEFRLPVRITEFDFNTNDEALQAEYTRDFLITMFSHPSVAGIQLWGFWAGSHWLPGAALYRKDWSERPNGTAYRELVTETWRTHSDGRTDLGGQWSHRSFYGSYRVTVTAGDLSQTVTFDHLSSDDTKPVRVTLR